MEKLSERVSSTEDDTISQFTVGAIVFFSAVSFYANNYWLMKNYVPSVVRTTARKEWKWRNIVNSFLHSFITGCGACYCFWVAPEMREDLVRPKTVASHSLVSFSIGYFIYDFLDMAINDRKGKTYELLVHHFMVTLCFGTSVVFHKYQGYALMALLIEVNSVFLHIRQLMILQDCPKSSCGYRINNSFNLATFVVFRILTLGWMTRWLVHHRNDIHEYAFNLAAVSLTIIMGMNILLLYRLLKSDYWQQTKPQVMAEEHLKTR